MVRLREISRTAVFAWSPGTGAPLVVTGTRTGALSEDLTNDTKLELWQLGLDRLDEGSEIKSVASLTTDSGFNDISWSEPSESHPLGVIAGALDNGSVDLWDADKLFQGASDAFISRTTKHTGAAKALQWNPWRHNLLASAGSKGEIFIYDLNNMANPYRLGASAARADDIECLDWNKQEKTAHILATGSSGGFVTVWDVKQKKDILTLNNQGRKAVSAVAWDPEESTKLATATPNDQEPLIFLWSLRNSSSPERTLQGHELGVLGLAWCRQDPELLLSCGKDNRTICWNPKTGERYGDFAAGSNWAFQTRWNPHNPNLIASASFDGNILINSVQATNSKPEEQASATQALDAEDFFAKAQEAPQGVAFNLAKPPKWTSRPSSVSFGFGGKLVQVTRDASSKSKISVASFAADDEIAQIVSEFEQSMAGGDIASICQKKIETASSEAEKADWRVIQTLSEGKSRKKIRAYIGFDDDDGLAKQTEKLSIDGPPTTNGDTTAKLDDDDFFGDGADGDNFLAQLASSKGTKTNSAFSLYNNSDSTADKEITRALLLGQFEQALEVCLKEDRISDAFMIAVCGGQACIDKVQAAYLKQKVNAPSYLRLLASVVGKNLWDVVHNADLQSWKDVMAALCTYADENEFSDLCEALGDRLEEASEQSDASASLRRDASFCYLVGSKLEKVVTVWVRELQHHETSALQTSESSSAFSVHVKCLQEFVEKVSVFRQVTSFKDSQLSAESDYKLAPLYKLYAEYADILAAHNKLDVASRYIDLIPAKFDGAEQARGRFKNASGRTAASVSQKPAAISQKQLPPYTQQTQPAPAARAPLVEQARNNSPYMPVGATTQTPSIYNPPVPPPAVGPYAPASNTYAPAGYTQQTPASAAPSFNAGPTYGAYSSPNQLSRPPLPSLGPTTPGPPPAATRKDIPNWNDMPEGFIKERQPASRKATPAPVNPFVNQVAASSGPPPANYNTFQPMASTPLPPPPKAGEIASRIASPPPVTSPVTQNFNPNPYAPTQAPLGSTLPNVSAPPLPRGTSPYQPPPATSHAAPSSRYAPAAGTVSSPLAGGVPQQRTVAPNPYSQPPPTVNYGPTPVASALPPTPASVGPPPMGPPRGPPAGPPRSVGPPLAGGLPQPVQLPSSSPEDHANHVAAETRTASVPPPAASRPKYPRGDRSHVPAIAQPIIDQLTPEMARIKSVAPEAFKPQVDDMEKRINILFDHLNNEDLLQPDTITQMLQISALVAKRDYETAQTLFVEMQTAKLQTEGTNWMVGIKRLIAIGRATNK